MTKTQHTSSFYTWNSSTTLLVIMKLFLMFILAMATIVIAVSEDRELVNFIPSKWKKSLATLNEQEKCLHKGLHLEEMVENLKVSLLYLNRE